MVVLDPEGSVVEGQLRPSSDTPTHLSCTGGFQKRRYCPYHSTWATTGASLRPFCLGTTHDYFYGEVPCTTVK